MINWRKYNRAIIPDTPPHLPINNTEEEIKLFIKQSKVFFARWESDFDCGKSTDFWFLINDIPMELEDYDSKTRGSIRKGLRECIVDRITIDQLINEGYEVYLLAFKKYKTYLQSKTKQEFIDEIMATPNNWEYWGVFYNKKMIGYSKVMVINNYAEYRSIKLHPRFLRHLPAESLIYTMNSNYLNKRKFKYVNNGARSIAHQTNFPLFLIRKFKFRKAYCRLNIVYNGKINLLVKCLYPFRGLLRLIRFGPFRQSNILLKQESIRRSFE